MFLKKNHVFVTWYETDMLDWGIFHGVRPDEPPCLYSSLVRTNQAPALRMAFCVFHRHRDEIISVANCHWILTAHKILPIGAVITVVHVLSKNFSTK